MTYFDVSLPSFSSISNLGTTTNGTQTANKDVSVFNYGSYVTDTGSSNNQNTSVWGWGPSSTEVSGSASGTGFTSSMPFLLDLGDITSNNYTSSSPGTGMSSANAGAYANVSLSQEQVNNAKIIADVGKSMGMSQRDIQIAIATAMQESGLRNINYGDRDSVGLFQQRPSCGWGTVAQCTDPVYAATQFFNHLKDIENRDSMSLAQAAQSVQRSAFPDAYAKWEGMAGSLLV